MNIESTILTSAKFIAIHHYFSSIPKDTHFTEKYDLLCDMDYGLDFPQGFYVHEPYEHYEPSWVITEMKGLAGTLVEVLTQISNVATSNYDSIVTNNYKDLYEESLLTEATAKQYAQEVDKQNKELSDALADLLDSAAENNLDCLSVYDDK